MKKTGRNHIIWILAISASWLIFDYCYYGFLDTSSIVKAFVLALVLEFGIYCIHVYRKDNEETMPN